MLFRSPLFMPPPLISLSHLSLLSANFTLHDSFTLAPSLPPPSQMLRVYPLFFAHYLGTKYPREASLTALGMVGGDERGLGSPHEKEDLTTNSLSEEREAPGCQSYGLKWTKRVFYSSVDEDICVCVCLCLLVEACKTSWSWLTGYPPKS